MAENRIPPPLLTLGLAAAMWFAAPDGTSSVSRTSAAIAVFLLAGVVGLPAMREFRRAGTTIDPLRLDKTTALVMEGVYRYTRNPMYLSLTLMLCAWAIWLGGVWVWVGPIALALWLDRFQIRPEERAMSRRFGADYDRYRRNVRRWL